VARAGHNWPGSNNLAVSHPSEDGIVVRHRDRLLESGFWIAMGVSRLPLLRVPPGWLPQSYFGDPNRALFNPPKSPTIGQALSASRF